MSSAMGKWLPLLLLHFFLCSVRDRIHRGGRPPVPRRVIFFGTKNTRWGGISHYKHCGRKRQALTTLTRNRHLISDLFFYQQQRARYSGSMSRVFMTQKASPLSERESGQWNKMSKRSSLLSPPPKVTYFLSNVTRVCCSSRWPALEASWLSENTDIKRLLAHNGQGESWTKQAGVHGVEA